MCLGCIHHHRISRGWRRSTIISSEVAADAAEPPEVVALAAVFPEAMAPSAVSPEVVAQAAEPPEAAVLASTPVWWWHPVMHFQARHITVKDTLMNIVPVLLRRLLRNFPCFYGYRCGTSRSGGIRCRTSRGVRGIFSSTLCLSCHSYGSCLRTPALL